MATSTAAPSTEEAALGSSWFDAAAARRATTRGFTLIEVSLVLLIISIMLALAIPRLRSATGAELSAQARKLTNTFRYLRNEAVLTGTVYQIHLDLDRQRYWGDVDPESVGPEAVAPGTNPLLRPVVLHSPVGISDVVLPDSGVGKLQAGRPFVNFYPDGGVDLVVIHMDDGREAYTLWVNPLTGRLFLTPGYQDVDYGR